MLGSYRNAGLHIAFPDFGEEQIRPLINLAHPVRACRTALKI